MPINVGVLEASSEIGVGETLSDIKRAAAFQRHGFTVRASDGRVTALQEIHNGANAI